MTKGFLYFIEAEGTDLAKIGFSIDPISRLYSLQAANASVLVLRGTVNATAGAEKALHALHRTHRVRGEWYPIEYAMGIYDDLGELCEAISPTDLSSVIVTEAYITA